MSVVAGFRLCLFSRSKGLTTSVTGVPLSVTADIGALVDVRHRAKPDDILAVGDQEFVSCGDCCRKTCFPGWMA